MPWWKKKELKQRPKYLSNEEQTQILKELRDLNQQNLWQMRRIAHLLESEHLSVNRVGDYEPCPRCEALVPSSEDKCRACGLDMPALPTE